MMTIEDIQDALKITDHRHCRAVLETFGVYPAGVLRTGVRGRPAHLWHDQDIRALKLCRDRFKNGRG